MLNTKKLFNVLFLALFFSLGLNAQNAKTESSGEEYRQGGWWTFGINGGLSYQTNDVCDTYDGWGVGLTLAKNVYYRPNAPLAFDLRGRFLYANQRGQDWERSYGLLNNQALNGVDRGFINDLDLNYLNNPLLASDSFYYANYRTDLVELGLEGVINLNRLKERTNVIVNLYGGLNLDWYKTRINQANDIGGLVGSEYDYSMVSSTDKSTALATLEGMMDDTYETVGDGFDNDWGTFTWMPSAGVELGYQLTPRFSIIGGHKVTWSRDDIMDGQRWTDENVSTGKNDIYHYTNVGLRWIIDPHDTTMDPPIIKVIRPNPLPYPTSNAYATVKAEIENVNSASDVNCTFNGNSFYNFSFNPKSENFGCSLNLVPGKNTLVITATNMAGQDVEDVVIIYNEPIAPPPSTQQPPVVDITRPSSSGKTVDNPKYDLDATVKHVGSRSDIKFYINGSLSSNYSYSFSSDKFEAPLTLQEGKNTIRIVGTNKDGSDEDQTVIIYQPEEAPCPEPTANIDNVSVPAATPMNPNVGRSTINATVRNAGSRSDIRMYINGSRMTDFSYNASNGNVTATVTLQNGRNEIAITVNTDCGTDEDKEVISFNAPTNPTNPNPNPSPTPNPTPQPQQPPIVDISTPNNGITTNNSSVNLVASVKHVTSKNQIRMTLNGSNYSNFSYNTNTRTVRANNVPIRVGNNVIEVKASNNAGTDSDDVLVIRQDNTPPPPPAPTPCPKPTVTINNLSVPAATPMNPNAGKSTLNATAKNVSSKNQIQMYINNSKTTNFTFNSSTGAISASLDLAKGTTTVKLVATTNCGTAQDSESVTFQPATIPKPVVNIIKPQNNITLNTQTTPLSTTVLNVTQKSDIKVQINGAYTNNFNYNANTNSVTGTVTLQNGKNTIKVSATNAGGSHSDTHTINYEKPVQKTPPVVNILKPTNGSKTTTQKVTLKATVLNVTRKSDVTVKLNGANVSLFNFSGNTVTAQLTVKMGNNKIEVIGRNKDGQDQKSVNVRYNKIAAPPTIKITKPATDRRVTKSNFTLKASTTNVNAKRDITFLLNGKNITTFGFNKTEGVITGRLTLVEGKNTVKITVKNTDGTASDSKVITYKVPVNKPKVEITNISVPAATPMNPNAGKSTLIASSQYVIAKKDITILVNNKKITDFTFSPKTGQITANLEFVKGANVVKVTVKNTGGQATDTENISF